MTEADLLQQFPGSTLNMVKTMEGETITLKLETGHAYWVTLKTEDLWANRDQWLSTAYQELAKQAATASL